MGFASKFVIMKSESYEIGRAVLALLAIVAAVYSAVLYF